ncbi:MAG: hypothetical protein KAH38_09485 [Candidatus Hydrogenedentes bacterium]|nr:hypothetical protein [Candidatus Hydrogenedentota bacterium]
MEFDEQLNDNLSWRVMCEVMRYAPGRFILLETHPGGGMYDCLSLYDKEGTHFVDFNRAGRIHFWTILRGDTLLPNNNIIDPIDYKREIQKGVSSKEIVDKICEAIDVPYQKKHPQSDTTVIMMRYIAAFMSHAAFGIYRWTCQNGYYDSSGLLGSQIQHEFFLKFPLASQSLSSYDRSRTSFDTAYHFWFLCRNGKPRLCLNTRGTLFDRHDNEYDLISLYQEENRSMWRVVGKTAGHEMKG